MNAVWFVKSESNGTKNIYHYDLFDTKEAAEAYARQEFPDESEDKRYARIAYRPVFTLKDVKGETK